MKTNIAVVIPNWNGKNFLSDCLDSLTNQSIEASIIVVDNGSTDGSGDLIRKKFPHVSVLEFADNAGFAGGVNRGIKHALKNNFKYIALFNNDAVASKSWLENLVLLAKKTPKAGIVTGKFMRDDKKHFDSTGDFYTTWGIGFPRGRNELDTGQYNQAEEVFGATGGASLYKASLFKDIGLFDEDFFAYFEDNDISFRARIAGWKIYYEPKSVAYHHVGGTSSKLGSFARYHSIKNVLILYTKNMPFPLYFKYLPLFFTLLVRMKLGSIRDGQLLAYIKGFFVGLMLLPGAFIKRRKIQSNKKVSYKDIDAILVHKRPPRPPKLGAVK